MKTHPSRPGRSLLAFALGALISLGALSALSGCAPAEEAAELPPGGVDAKIQTYSARGQGIDIIPRTIPGTDQVLGCTVVSLDSGQGRDISPEICQSLIQDLQRPPAQYCQALFDSEIPLLVEPSKCDRMITDGQESDGGADASAVRAALSADAVLKYFKTRHQRDGLDGRGGANVSVVHIGVDFSNAFYAPEQNLMAYGDGNGQTERDFTHGRDLAAHELTHGVVANSARFLSFGEPAAVNEATADFFAEMVEGQGDWILAEDVTISGQGFRNLRNPGALQERMLFDGQLQTRPYPAHVREAARVAPGEECGMRNDDCYEHFNSTIVSHALFRMAQAVGSGIL